MSKFGDTIVLFRNLMLYNSCQGAQWYPLSLIALAMLSLLWRAFDHLFRLHHRALDLLWRSQDCLATLLLDW